MTFNLTSLPSSPLYVTSNDTTNTTTVSSLSILLCDCKNNGTCITSDNYPLNSGRHYRLMCECLNGFGGLYCEEDLRVCGYDPCPTYSECVSISGGGYRCTDCADGYTDNSEMKCVGKWVWLINYAVYVWITNQYSCIQQGVLWQLIYYSTCTCISILYFTT